MAHPVKTFGDTSWDKGHSAPHGDVDYAEQSFDPEARNVGERLYAADPNIKNNLITGGAGFMCVTVRPAALRGRAMASEAALFDTLGSRANSASYAVRKFALLYPEYNVIVFDKLDYCASLNNCRSLEGMPNYHFVKVGSRAHGVVAVAAGFAYQPVFCMF